MKNLLAVITVVSILGVATGAQAAGWNNDLDADIKYSNFNHINVVAAAHPEQQGDIAFYLLKQSEAFKSTPDRQAKIFKAATPFVGKIPAANASMANGIIEATVRIAADQKFQQSNPHEASDIFVNALLMSNQPNLAAANPKLHAEVLQAADDFFKKHPQDADKRRLEMASLAQGRSAPAITPAPVVNTNGAIGTPAVVAVNSAPGALGAADNGIVTASAQNGTVNQALNAAIKRNDFNQINIIAASHPEQQGAIAIYLLEQSQAYHSDPDREARIFKAATPFVGRVQAANAGQVNDIIEAKLKVAADPTFQQKNPREATDLFLSALLMSGQPNIVAYNPNLHAKVLEAANDFIKKHPQDADKRLMEEVSLSQAGGAPEVTPKGVINPSAE